MTTSQPLDSVIDFPLVVANQTLQVTALQMGNPNCCIFVKVLKSWIGADSARLSRIIRNFLSGRTSSSYESLTGQTSKNAFGNAVSEKLKVPAPVRVRAVVASVINGKTDRIVDVHAPGGLIPIEWRDDDEVVLTGRAEVVYNGEWLGPDNSPQDLVHPRIPSCQSNIFSSALPSAVLSPYALSRSDSRWLRRKSRV
jgi:diaminopimelate epimerase